MQIPNICPNCRIGLNPVDEGGKVMLRCARCGHSEEFKNFSKHECSACGYDKAVVTFYGVVIGDEPPLVLHKCIKCGNVDREGVS